MNTFASILSVLLLGITPTWSGMPVNLPATSLLSVEPPVFRASLQTLNRLSASGVLVADLQSAQPLLSRNAEQSLPMASLTKLMTALVIVEKHDLNEKVVILDDIAQTPGSTVELPVGETFSVGDLLSALLVASANDAAMALAQYHSGSEATFVQEMNDRAKSLGLQRTSFANAAGFDDPQQRSSAQDIAWLAMSVLRRPELRERLSLPQATISSDSGTIIALQNTHQLLQPDSPVFAGKTGTTPAAKQCLLSIFKNNGREYVAVLLHSDNRYGDMRSILRAFDTPAGVAVLPPPL